MAAGADAVAMTDLDMEQIVMLSGFPGPKRGTWGTYCESYFQTARMPPMSARPRSQ